MSIKEAEVYFRPGETSCRYCGHPHLTGTARRRGSERLWVAYCEACHRVQELAEIPDWFWQGLPSPPPLGGYH